MMLRFFLATGALLSTPTMAQTAVPAASTKAAPDAKPKQVCRRDVETGSIMMSKKVCHTRQEWQVIDGANASNVDRFRDRAGARSAPAGT